MEGGHGSWGTGGSKVEGEGFSWEADWRGEREGEFHTLKLGFWVSSHYRYSSPPLGLLLFSSIRSITLLH